ncbi:MAG: DUF2281 domain-containing protein [Sediminibacterium sp.]
MTNAKLFSEIATLPATLKAAVVGFVHTLLQKKKKKNSTGSAKPRQFGCAKGLINLSADFDAPITDFNDHM